MRTTLQVDDDILQAAKALARSQQRSLGKVISDLARRGLQPSGKQSVHHGFPVFTVAADASPVTDADVKAALDDEL
jgi:hypothetical protein